MKISSNSSLLAKKIILLVAIVAVGFVGASLYMRATNGNYLGIADTKFQELASEYYEDYYYPKLIKDYSDGLGNVNKEAVFGQFVEQGLPMVRLRNILLYENRRNEKYRSVFEKPNFKCDTNNTYVIFKPVQPFEVKNYTMSYELYCK